MSALTRALLLATEVRMVAARSVGQDYRTSVALPASYVANPERRYPTVYLTDAEFYFGMVTELTRWYRPLCLHGAHLPGGIAGRALLMHIGRRGDICARCR